MNPEPDEAFPYQPPTDQIRKKYKHIFEIKTPLRPRMAKVVFDKFVAAAILFFTTPLLIIIKIAFLIEGFLVPENSGPMFFYYHAVSEGRIIRKYKIRIIKEKYIDPVGAKNHEWLAYSSEWNSDSRTFVGSFVKKYYLDEIPQFWSVIIGDMSIVGPRPISVMHYERDRAQGNVSRFLLRGGLLGLGHINKGTSEMGNPIYEYEYIDNYLKKSSFEIFCLDLWVIWKGIILMTKGGGH